MSSVGTVDKALDVLFQLHREPGPRGVTELGRALGIPKSSVHRLLASLSRRGLVERNPEGRYQPGMALVALGVGVLDREPVVAAARPVLELEAETQEETLFLAAARAGRLRVLDKAEGSGFLRAAPRVGETVPVHATAVGKLYLAFGPEQVYGEDPRPRFTPRTRLGRALEREVDLARRRGWAENRDEWLPGLAAIAAPIQLGDRLVGALALAAPTTRLRATDTPKRARRMVAAARRIAARLEGEVREGMD